MLNGNSSKRLKIAEVYPTIQGEALSAGRPCVIARMAGCNLNCSYCDTPQAKSGGTDMSIDVILEETEVCGINLVLVTGGEPLLQKETPALLTALLGKGKEVVLETNGSFPISLVPQGVTIVMDIKCPGSGCSQSNPMENLADLRENDEVKFVLCGRADYEWAKDIMERSDISGPRVGLSPVRNMLEPRELALWMLEDALDARLNLQLHHVIWPEGERRRLER